MPVFLFLAHHLNQQCHYTDSYMIYLFDRSGSYSYKYSMCFLVKYADGSMQSVGDSFAKIELFSESNDPTKRLPRTVGMCG